MKDNIKTHSIRFSIFHTLTVKNPNAANSITSTSRVLSLRFSGPKPKRPVVLSVYIDSKQYVDLLVILCFLIYNMIYAIVKTTFHIKKLNMANHTKLVKGKTF